MMSTSVKVKVATIDQSSRTIGKVKWPLVDIFFWNLGQMSAVYLSTGHLPADHTCILVIKYQIVQKHSKTQMPRAIGTNFFRVY